MVAWVLNFGAEEELASRTGRRTPSRALLAMHDALVAKLRALVARGDVVLGADAKPGDGSGHAGDVWCPTPDALDALRRAGAEVPAAPSLAVLRLVTSRAFSASLGQMLDGAAYVTREAAVLEVLDRGARAHGGDVDSAWLLKRPFSFAGRGRRKVRAGELTADERGWIAASLRAQGGLQVEPYVAREADYGLHGWIDLAGELALGAPTVQTCDDYGAWLATRRAAAGELAAEEERALVEEASRAGRALHAAGFFGPFGVDAYRYRDARGAARFNARSEVNARYSMGWAIGFGPRKAGR